MDHFQSDAIPRLRVHRASCTRPLPLARMYTKSLSRPTKFTRTSHVEEELGERALAALGLSRSPSRQSSSVIFQTLTVAEEPLLHKILLHEDVIVPVQRPTAKQTRYVFAQ